MNETDLEITLNQLPLRNLRQRGSNYFASCPSGTHQDKRPSWGISVNEPHLHGCLSCGYKGTLRTLLVDIGGMDWHQASIAVGESAYTKPRDLVINFEFGAKDKVQAREVSRDELMLFYRCPRMFTYLKIRGISEKIARRAGLLYDKRLTRLIFPWFIDGKLYCVTGRALRAADAEKYGKSMLYVESVMKRSLIYLPFGVIKPEPLILVEGEIDALRVAQAGFENVAGLGHSQLTEEQIKLLLHSPATEFYVFADDDKAGRKLIEWANKTLAPKKRTRIIDYKPVDRSKYRDDVNLDPGMLEDEDIQACLFPRSDTVFSFVTTGRL